jgi:hypothetical protein
MGLALFLDATAFHDDYRHRAAFRILFEEAQRLHIRVLLPAVVLDEATNQHRERLEKLASDLSSLGAHALRLAGFARSKVAELDDAAIVANVSRYREDLERWVKITGGRVLPYPAVIHADVVARDLQRRKPFSESGKGYRDALIWFSMLEYLRANEEPFALVTNNHRDFGQEPEFHPDMARDLDALGGDRKRHLFATVERFVAAHVRSNLDEAIDLKKKLQADAVEGFSLARWAEAEVLQILDDEEAEELFSPLPYETGNVEILSIVGFHGVTLDDVRRLAHGDLLVAATVSLTVELSVGVNSGDIEKSEAARSLFHSLPSIRIGEYATLTTKPRVAIGFTSILSPAYETLSTEIDDAASEDTAVWINPHPGRLKIEATGRSMRKRPDSIRVRVPWEEPD